MAKFERLRDSGIRKAIELMNSGSSKSIIPLILSFGLLVIFSYTLCSQDNDVEFSAKYMAGVSVSHASAELLPDNSANYIYRSMLIKLPMAKELKRSENWSIYLDLVPQFNIGEYSEEDVFEETETNFEFGASLGVSFHRRFSFLSFYLGIQLGPHYINKTPEFQSSGFIFSDTGELGLLFDLNDKVNKLFYYEFGRR